MPSQITIPDPIQLMETRRERLYELFVDEYTCMLCGKRVDYELLCMDPTGEGPAVCVECSGMTDEQLASIGY